MLKLKPNFSSDWKYDRLLFRSVTLTAAWDDDDASYSLKSVHLSDRPERPSGFGPDFRRKPIELRIDFIEFNARVKSAVEQLTSLDELRSHYGSELCEIIVPLRDKLQMTPIGIFLQEWPLAPILTGDADAKLATLAVLDMLEIEATLPSYRL